MYFCLGNNSAVAERPTATGMLSERGFTGWGSGTISESELLAEYDWMERLASVGKPYYSINEV